MTRKLSFLRPTSVHTSTSSPRFLFAPLRGHIPCLAVSVSMCLCALVFVCVNACVCRCLCVCLVVCVFVCGGVDTLSTPSSLFCLTPPPQALSPFFSTHNAPAHFVRAPVFTTIPYMFQHLDMKCSFSNGFRHCCHGTLVFTKFFITHTPQKMRRSLRTLNSRLKRRLMQSWLQFRSVAGAAKAAAGAARVSTSVEMRVFKVSQN